MRDQAESLRQVMQEEVNRLTVSTQVQDHQTSRVIAVASGKGGVGKSNFCVNFAAGLAQAGLHPVILDADMGFANIEVLLGVQPKYTLLDLLVGQDIADVVQDSPAGISFISAGTGLSMAHSLTALEMNRLAAQMQKLQDRFDVVLLDIGGGYGGNLGYLLGAVDELILVMTPEPTAIADAYALLKMLRLGPGLSPTKLVVNRVHSFAEGRLAADKIRLAVERFLDCKIDVLGYVLEDESVPDAVMRQQLLLHLHPDSVSAQCIRQLVHNYLHVDPKPVKRGITGFLERWLQRLRAGGEAHSRSTL